MKIILLILSLFLLSCKTTERNIQTTSFSERNSLSDVRTNQFSASALIDSMKAYLDADIQIITKEYSRPDSTGQQYVQKESMYNILLSADGERFKSHIGENLKQSLKGRTDTQKNQNQINDKSESDSRVFKPPIMVMIGLIGLVLILLALLFHRKL